jgi:hypothetical protein
MNSHFGISVEAVAAEVEHRRRSLVASGTRRPRRSRSAH